MKKLTNVDQFKQEELVVENLKDLPENEQAELIADKFSEVANEYEELKAEDISIPPFSDEDIPVFSEEEVAKIFNDGKS